MFDGIIYCFYFVDDFIAMAMPQHCAKLQKFKKDLMSTFQMRECDTNRFLGIRMLRNRQERKVWLLQDVYITNMSIKYALDHVTKTSTPLPITYSKLPEPITNLSDNYHAFPRLI